MEHTFCIFRSSEYNLHEPEYNFQEPEYNLHKPVTLSYFHSVSGPVQSVRGTTGYIFWTLWPTAFGFQFPNCIFAKCIFLSASSKFCKFLFSYQPLTSCGGSGLGELTNSARVSLACSAVFEVFRAWFSRDENRPAISAIPCTAHNLVHKYTNTQFTQIYKYECTIVHTSHKYTNANVHKSHK